MACSACRTLALGRFCFRKDALLSEAELDRAEFQATGFFDVVRQFQFDDGAADVLHVARRATGASPNVAVFVEFDLTGVADPKGQRKFDEVLGFGIESVEGVVAGAADPDHAVGRDIEGIGNLVEVVWQRVGGPLLGGGIKLAESRSQIRAPRPCRQARREVGGDRGKEVPFGDVPSGTLGLIRPIRLPFTGIDHAVDRSSRDRRG